MPDDPDCGSLSHLVNAYTDAVAYVDAVRADDGPGMEVIARHACQECLLPSVAQIAARLADRDGTARAAEEALARLQRLAEGQDRDGD